MINWKIIMQALVSLVSVIILLYINVINASAGGFDIILMVVGCWEKNEKCIVVYFVMDDCV